MTEQYLRQVKLLVGDAGGEAVDLSGLSLQFTVQNSSSETPKSAEITVINPTQQAAVKILEEYTRIELHAGYEGNMGLIFSGQIISAKIGRSQGLTETFAYIQAQDCDTSYTEATISKTLAKGHTPQDEYEAYLEALKPFGVEAGNTPTFMGGPALRGTTLHGMVKDNLRQFAADQKSNWWIEGDKLYIVPESKALDDSGAMAQVIGPDRGMVGSPTLTINGMEASCLLNPRIRVGRVVRIDNDILGRQNSRNSGTGASEKAEEARLTVAGLDPSGFYKALSVTHRGDTHGNDWYTDIVGVALDPSRPGLGMATTVQANSR